MDSPLTPGMSSLLYFGDETFEYPALETGTTPLTKDRYGGYIFEQRDLDSLEAGDGFLNDFESPRTFTANKVGESGRSASAQTPALTTGPSAVNPTSSSTSQASPSVAPDYFSRPRQPNSDGNSAHFVTAKPVESSDFSEFRNAINKRFHRAREVISSVQRSALANEYTHTQQQSPINDDSMDFSFSDFEAHQQSDEYRHAEFLEAAVQSMAPTSDFGVQTRAPSEAFHYPEIDPALAIDAGQIYQGLASQQQAHSVLDPPPPSSSPKPIIAEDAQPAPPIKRRRRRKAPPSAEVKAQKHKAFLERNREAASKCRTKKKTQIQQLEEDERDGRALNQMLKDEFRDVLGEVLLLREQVKLRRMACGGDCVGKCGALAEKKETGADLMDGVEHSSERDGNRDEDAKVGVDLEEEDAKKVNPAAWDSESEEEEEGSEDESDDEQEELDTAEKKKRKGTRK